MARRVAVVGSGPAGVCAARALLDAGFEVDMLDYGNQLEEPRTEPDESTSTRSPSHLWKVLRRQACLLDINQKTFLGSSFPFQDVDWGIPVRAPGPISRSLGRGGLSNVWGAAVYPLTEEDYLGWPLKAKEMEAHYRVVAELLSLSQREDALACVYPLYGGTSEGLPLNPTSALLERHWEVQSDALTRRNLLAGRARLAVRDKECQLCGLCLTGCPYDAIYRADWTLRSLLSREGFRYRDGLLVERFEERSEGVQLSCTGAPCEESYEAVFLAAGTVSSLRIAVDSLQTYGREVELVDNDLYLVPFWCRAGSGGSVDSSFALNELALRVIIEGHPLHLQLYTLSEAVQARMMPLLPAPARALVGRLLGRMLVGFVYLPGRCSARFVTTVEPESPRGRVCLTPRPHPDSNRIVKGLLRHLRAHSRELGLYPLGLAWPSTPWAASGGHLAASLPMVDSPGPLQTDLEGKLHGTERVYIVDGGAMPGLPAQNSTFTLMANAHRIGAGYGEPGGGRSPTIREPATDQRYGRSSVNAYTAELDHHKHQYGSPYTAPYHHYVNRLAVSAAGLRPGDWVLDYACGHQRLRRALPAGVHYLGYDLREDLSDFSEPQSRSYDCIFALQVLMCMDGPGLKAWVETFRPLCHRLVVMMPSRNELKDKIMDRLFGLAEHRQKMVQSTPEQVYDSLGRGFRQVRALQVLKFMGEITVWEPMPA